MEKEFVKIGPIKYKIITENKLTDEDGGTRLDGFIKYAKSEIKLDANLGPQARREVMWHEIIHGILTGSGISDHDERQVDAIAHGVMSVLIDNGWLAEDVSEL